MQTVEITRAGDLSVADHLAEMQCWLDHAGIRVTDLFALHILRGQVTFSITFRDTADANYFLQAFCARPNEDSPARLPTAGEGR